MKFDLKTVRFAAGIVKDDTPLSSEGRWVAGGNVRFRNTTGDEKVPALPESVGGWQTATQVTVPGIARGAHAWVADDISQLAFGTALGLYCYAGGDLTTITPKQIDGFLKDPFSTKSGSNVVTVLNNVFDADANTATTIPHGLRVGQKVNFQHADAIGGLTIEGDYTVTEVLTPTRFTITAAANATSTATSSGAAIVWFQAIMVDGQQHGTGGLGFGTGGYGLGPYGQPNLDADFLPTIWSVDSWGRNGVALRRGGPIYEQQPVLSAPELVFGGDLSAPDGWAAGTGWSISGGKATATAGTASNLSQNRVDILKGGSVYRLSVDITVTAGTVKFGLNAGDPTPAVLTISPIINKTGTYSMRFLAPANVKDIVFAKDSAFAGSVDNVSIKLERTAYRIDEAPIRSDIMFVDANQIMVALSTYEVAGDFNRMCVRTSDRGNNRQWVPDTNNFASQYVLSMGGKIMGGLPARQQNLLWTDQALYSQKFTGTPGNPYTYDMIGTGCGMISQHAAAEIGGFAFWMSNNRQFYAVDYDFQGVLPRPIPCTMADDIFDNIAPGQESKIFAWVNTQFNEIWWFYPDKRVGDGLEVNSYAMFSLTEKCWSCGEMSRTAGVAAGIWSSPILIGYDAGTPPKSRLYFHETGATADGNALSSFITSGEFDVGDGKNLMRISRFVADFKDQVGPMTLEIYGRGYARDEAFAIDPKTIQPGTSYVDLRIMARRIWFTLRSNGSPSAWRLGAIQVEAAPSSARR